MIDLIKKVLFTGVGMASLTKKKIEEIVKDMSEKGDMSEKEGKELVDELMKKSEESRKEFEGQVEKFVRDSLSKMNLATRDDLLKVEKQVQKLSEALAALDTKE